jgi:hypothetical protein
LLQLSAAEEDTHEEGIESGDTDELPFAATTTSIFSLHTRPKTKKQKKYNLRLSPTHFRQSQTSQKRLMTAAAAAAAAEQ